jgi:hypothetical protein
MNSSLWGLMPKAVKRRRIEATHTRTSDTKSRSPWQKRLWWTGLDRKGRDAIVSLDNAWADFHEEAGDQFVDWLWEAHQEGGYITGQDVERALQEAISGVIGQGSDVFREKNHELSTRATEQALETVGIDPVLSATSKLIQFSSFGIEAQGLDDRIEDNYNQAMSRIRSLPANVVEDLREKLIKAVQIGADTRQVIRALIGDLIEEIDPEGVLPEQAFRQAVREIWNRTKTDIERVVRTESINNYARSQLQEWWDQGIRTVTRHSINDPKTCAKCRDLSNPQHNRYQVEDLLALEHPVTEDMDHPGEFLTHPNCRCILPGTSVRGNFVAGSRASYDGPAVEIRTVGGEAAGSKCLRVTTNHPVLTTKGMVAAGDLVPGDDLIGYGLDMKDPISGSGAYDNQEPALIEDVFHALRASPEACHDRFACAADEFHGDSARFVGEVEVVRFQSNLRGHLGYEPSERDLLIGSHGNSPLNGSCSKGSATATEAHVSIRAVAPAQVRQVGLTPDLDAALHKLAAEGGHPDANRASDLSERLTGPIAVDQIVEIRRFHYVGHVYDLQSTSGLMFASGLVVSNCWFRPVLEDVWAELENMEKNLFQNIDGRSVTVSDVPVDQQEPVKKIVQDWNKNAEDVKANFGFVEDITADPDWQDQRREELTAEDPENAETRLTDEISENAVVEWVDPDGTVKISDAAADSAYITLTFARRQGEIRWEGIDRDWWEKRYQEKMAETEMTLEEHGVQIIGGLPFFTRAAGTSARDYFVESYAHYMVDPVLIYALDRPAYSHLRDNIFGAVEYLERGGVK